ncbi:hypothetical protein [Gracilibacillus dipsosauri]|uniref:Uncharacterized protein n=1 Tax=Gracilibacillus dipsosauri TaxID=178340 RepID=A0A317KVT7_9BACI|nr:hypothetical protein [Gracilibacillus dipsosauri]PWU66548.1 hypothetical protein DLJ74_19175 [Gracilibacillus dipsosauri]
MKQTFILQIENENKDLRSELMNAVDTFACKHMENITVYETNEKGTELIEQSIINNWEGK